VALGKYRTKRRFKKTPEPFGKLTGSSDSNFVIQKHNASHLHYDFRLQMEGVLKSWAIPKKPTLDPKIKRLAVQVEDHPLEYINFEGVIPEGNYGAGTVEIWDKGKYKFLDNKNLESGHLTFLLKGKKLKGEFALVKIQKIKGENYWLFIKANDEFSREKKFSEEPVKNEKEVFWLKGGKLDLSSLPPKDIKMAKPMMTTLVHEPFDSPDWLYEIKWDGYRALALIKNGSVELISRNQLSLNKRFPELVSSLKKLSIDCILDGEITVLNDKGYPDFHLIQDYSKTKEGNLIYYVFDVLNISGKNCEVLPLTKRKQILDEILTDLPYLKKSEFIEKEGKRFFEIAKINNIEGIIAKKKDSLYHEGVRSKDWLKIKALTQQEVVVGGFTKPKNGRKYFGSLLVGIFEKDKFRFIGGVGTGFTEKDLEMFYSKLRQKIIKDSPFGNFNRLPNSTWVAPDIVIEIRYQELTKDKMLRQAVFLGLREDKNPNEVTFEDAEINKSKF